VILYAHGNAEDIGGVRDIMEEYRAAGFEVYTFDYRGNGISDGKPSTDNSYEDISSVYSYLVEQKGRTKPSTSTSCPRRALGG